MCIAPIFRDIMPNIADAMQIANCEIWSFSRAYVDDPEDYFHAEDFRIGDTISLAGRNVLVYDCDDVTKKFYKQFLDRGM